MSNLTKSTIEKVLTIAEDNGYISDILPPDDMSTLEALKEDAEFTQHIMENRFYILDFTSKPFIDSFFKYLQKGDAVPSFLEEEAKYTLIGSIGYAIYNSTLEEFFTGLIK